MLIKNNTTGYDFTSCEIPDFVGFRFNRVAKKHTRIVLGLQLRTCMFINMKKNKTSEDAHMVQGGFFAKPRLV